MKKTNARYAHAVSMLLFTGKGIGSGKRHGEDLSFATMPQGGQTKDNVLASGPVRWGGVALFGDAILGRVVTFSEASPGWVAIFWDTPVGQKHQPL